MSSWSRHSEKFERMSSSPFSFPVIFTTSSAKTTETLASWRTSVRATFDQVFQKKSSHEAQGDIEKECFSQDATSDIFFVLERPNGTVSKVDASSFIDYILTTGDYTDPETRLPLSEETLQRLDIFGKRLGKPGVISARIEKAEEFERQNFIRDALHGLENLAGEYVTQMYDAVESVNQGRETSEDATVRLLTDVFPPFEDVIKQVLSTDPEAGRICVLQFESFLRGPTQKPTPDPHGFLQVVMNGFHSACGQE